MTISDTVSLLSSIGACFAAIAAFLSVREAAKHRRLSYRPELALSSVTFTAKKRQGGGIRLPLHWIRNDDNFIPASDSTYAAIPLANIGLAAAKNISLSWSFPIEAMTQRVREIANEVSCDAEFSYADGRLTMRSNEFGHVITNWEFQRQRKIDYVIPVAIQKEAFALQLPGTYTLLVAALVHLSARKGEFDLPIAQPLRLHATYYDIADDKYEMSFDIRFELVAISPEDSERTFHGVLSPEKIGRRHESRRG